MTKKRKIAVVGGGITGLSAAYFLKEGLKDTEHSIDLFEKSNRLGGVIESKKTKDLLLEAGPDSFFTAKPYGLKLCQRLGLSDSLITTNSKFRQSLLAQNDKLYPLPQGFVMFAPSQLLPFLKSDLISLKGKLRAFMELAIPKRYFGDEESVAQFVERRFGQEVLEKVAQPMIGGIYVGDVNKLSAESAVPQFVDLERTSGSVTSGLIRNRQKDSVNKSTKGARYSMFLSLKNGMQELVDKLASSIEPENIHYQAGLSGIEKKGNRWLLNFDNHESAEYDAVLVTLPSDSLKEPIGKLDPEVSCLLAQIPCASSAVVNFVFDRDQTDYKFDAFGFVVPAIENRPIVAASFSSVKFKDRCPGNEVIVRVFLGGVLQEDILKGSDEELIELAHREISNYLSIKGNYKHSWLNRYDRAMPQYLIGHKHRVRDIFSRLEKYEGLELAGNSYNGVGIPDCIHSANNAADSICRYLEQIKE